MGGRTGEVYCSGQASNELVLSSACPHQVACAEAPFLCKKAKRCCQCCNTGIGIAADTAALTLTVCCTAPDGAPAAFLLHTVCPGMPLNELPFGEWPPESCNSTTRVTGWCYGRCKDGYGGSPRVYCASSGFAQVEGKCVWGPGAWVAC